MFSYTFHRLRSSLSLTLPVKLWYKSHSQDLVCRRLTSFMNPLASQYECLLALVSPCWPFLSPCWVPVHSECKDCVHSLSVCCFHRAGPAGEVVLFVSGKVIFLVFVLFVFDKEVVPRVSSPMGRLCFSSPVKLYLSSLCLSSPMLKSKWHVNGKEFLGDILLVPSSYDEHRSHSFGQ